jgi:hypothetical protein
LEECPVTPRPIPHLGIPHHRQFRWQRATSVATCPCIFLLPVSRQLLVTAPLYFGGTPKSIQKLSLGNVDNYRLVVREINRRAAENDPLDKIQESLIGSNTLSGRWSGSGKYHWKPIRMWQLTEIAWSGAIPVRWESLLHMLPKICYKVLPCN